MHYDYNDCNGAVQLYLILLLVLKNKLLLIHQLLPWWNDALQRKRLKILQFLRRFVGTACEAVSFGVKWCVFGLGVTWLHESMCQQYIVFRCYGMKSGGAGSSLIEKRNYLGDYLTTYIHQLDRVPNQKNFSTSFSFFCINQISSCRKQLLKLSAGIS
jgi:hypothetical protein